MAPPNKTTIKRINKEIADLRKEDTGGMILNHDEANIYNWTGWLPGPAGSPYEGGRFEVGITLPMDYPFSPPKLKFKTPVYHCNVSKDGSICLDTLKNNWSPALSLLKVMLSLSSLLTDPNEKDPLEASVANMFKKNRAEHDRLAKQWTMDYAMDSEARSKRKATEQQDVPPSRNTPSHSMSDVPSRPISSTGRIIASSASNPSRPASSSSGQQPLPNGAGDREAPIEIDDEEEADAEGEDKQTDGSAGGRRVRARTSGGGVGTGAEPIVVD